MENSTSPTADAWYEKRWLVIVLCIFLFPVGLYALWKNSSIRTGWKIANTAIILSLVLLYAIGGANGNRSTTTSSASDNTAAVQPSAGGKAIGIGDVLKTDYFDVTVHDAKIRSTVETGNPYTNLTAEQGNQYLIINVSFKNTDKESRMIFDGTVWITYNGKEYEFDKSETIMLEGWGVALDQINPLTTKTTNLVYKIPQEISGAAYWQPGRAGKKERVSLGEITKLLQ